MESIVTLYSAVRGNSAVPSWSQKAILLGVLTQDNSEYSAATTISGLSALRLFEGETELASLFNVTSDVTERGKRFVEGTSFDKYGFSCWEQWIIETEADNNNNNATTHTNGDTNMNSIYTDPAANTFSIETKCQWYTGQETVSQWVACPCCGFPAWVTISEDENHDVLYCTFCNLRTFDGDITDMPDTNNASDAGCEFCEEEGFCATCDVNRVLASYIRRFIRCHHEYGSVHTADTTPSTVSTDSDDMDDPFAG